MKRALLALIVFSLFAVACGGGDSTSEPLAQPTATVEPETTSDTPQETVAPAQLDDLTGKIWILTDIGEESGEWEFNEDIRVDLQFVASGGRNIIKGNSGCNTYRGVFGIDGYTLFIDNLTNTEMACMKEGAMEQEAGYLAALRIAHSFQFADNGDSLMIMYGMTVPNYLVFKPQSIVSPTPTPTPAPSPTAKPTPEPTPVVIPTPIGVADITVNVFISFQKPEDEEAESQSERCESPVNVGFYPEGSPNEWLKDPEFAMYYFSGTTNCVSTESGTRVMVAVGPVSSGTYDITADTPTTLMNVNRGVHIE